MGGREGICDRQLFLSGHGVSEQRERAEMSYPRWASQPFLPLPLLQPVKEGRKGRETKGKTEPQNVNSLTPASL